MQNIVTQSGSRRGGHGEDGMIELFLFFVLQIAREVDLQRDLSNDHVVGFHSYFEDEDNVYIVLENCSRKV